VLCAAAGVVLYAGWAAFWFQCDDAYIAFRYASNGQQGWGYTWNPPPFRPVEGYTSFLWVVLLDAVWRVTGSAPPQTANGLALGFSAASLALAATMVLRLRLSERLAPGRTAFLALVLAGTLTNRTFLAWTSSGLETALFGFLLLAWVCLALFVPDGGGSRTALALVAGLLALARPDGLLFAAATAGLLAARLFAGRARSVRAFAPALGLLLPVAHLLWRRATYGYWLPNTYHAKHVAAWPEAGLRYFAAFVLEYAYWIWLALPLGLVARGTNGSALAARLRGLTAERAPALAVGGALVLHLAYYTLVVGGDHFEFRVYQHLVPLLLVSFPVLCDRLGLSLRGALAALVAMIVLGWPLPWLHWWHTRELTTRGETFMLRYPVAPHLPPGLRAYGAAWDGLEDWLIRRAVGTRHQEHKIFGDYQRALFPTREVGSRLAGDERPVMAYHTVGVPGWVLPHVAIIDVYGLNDAVIAHTAPPASRTGQRSMGHDRRPPAGYVECFRPNVMLGEDGRLVVIPRERTLTADEIRACERHWDPDSRQASRASTRP
jgi:arabinofuranosyltransferase